MKPPTKPSYSHSRSSVLDLVKKFSSTLALSAAEFGCAALALGAASGEVAFKSSDWPGAPKVGNLLDEKWEGGPGTTAGG